MEVCMQAMLSHNLHAGYTVTQSFQYSTSNVCQMNVCIAHII